ncbi:MAG TPA: hypothetical protein PL070_17465 [Flavobacteriales bacterium]|nr:hypothetical protein [Flavobacteriales bacterium]
MSFALFESCMNGAFRIQTLQDVNAATAGIQALLNTEKERLSNMRYGKQLGLQLDDTEWRIARLMAERLFRLYGKKHDTRMRPSFLGCGVLFAAEGDVHYEETLVEVKAGSRSISVYDLRQLLVYAALNDRSKEYPIRSLEICNPRTGFRWHERLAVVAENIAGATSVEIYNEIIDYVSSEHRSL